MHEEIIEYLQDGIKEAWCQHFKADDKMASYYHGMAQGLNDCLIHIYMMETKHNLGISSPNVEIEAEEGVVI